MDIAMPELDGIEATIRLLEKKPGIKVLTLSMFGDEEYYYKMIHAGVKGFVLKSSGISELERAIEAVGKGESYFSNELLRRIITKLGQRKDPVKQNQEELNPLTEREKEILGLICGGLSNPEIADKLNISETTVKTHRANLMSKTNCNNTANLVMYAIKNKFVQI
jgi:DNA-binding NarL/FixJ family response regulator